MNLLWAVVAVLLILWLVGMFAFEASGLIHLLLVVALVAIVWNLLTKGRAV